MMLTRPCSVWPFDETCCDLPDDVPDEVMAKALDQATEILWMASGRRYGTCETVARPCLRRCSTGGYTGPYRDSAGQWVNAGCGCREACSCTELCEIVLPGPVAEILEVTIDGAPVTDWRVQLVDGQPRLIRTGGNCWPSCQDHTVECGEPGSFCVKYLRGVEVPELGVAAHSELACELAKACIPGCLCRLPRNIASKARQGVTITFEAGKPWWRVLPSVAAFLDLVNPKGLSRPPRVFSPDVPRSRIEVSGSGDS